MSLFLRIFTIGLGFLLVIRVPSLLAAACPAYAAFEEGLTQSAYYETPQGNTLRYTHFKSPGDEPKNSIFFLQGRGTFLEFYEVLVLQLLERNFDVWMYDLSGQGGSSRLLSTKQHDEETTQQMQHIDSFEHYVSDAHAFIEDVLLPQAQGQLFLGGYSTGGHVALRYLQCHPKTPFKAAFVISPLLALKAPILNTAMTYLLWGASFCFKNLEFYLPGTGPEDPIFHMSFEGNPYSGDASGFQDIQQLCRQNRPYMMGGVSLGWVKAAVDSVEALWKKQAIQTISIPVLIATGGADGVVDVSYNAQFTNQLQKSKHVFYPEGRHELFRETPEIRTTWWSDFDDFLLDLF